MANAGHLGRPSMFSRAHACVACCLAVAWFACHVQADGLVGREHVRAIGKSLVGPWQAQVGTATWKLEFASDHRFSFNGAEGQYVIEGTTLKLRTHEGESTYQFELAADTLTLSGGDLTQPTKFSRQTDWGGYLRETFRFSGKSAWLKLQRVLIVLGIVVASRLVIFLLRALSRFVIFSERGPLRFIHRYHKNRTLTIHSLVLNGLKYVVYFSALGFVLSELGVNYTAYLASLSVIGLAIGFGSQGLVQDVVTGFFIIFEGQFEVGDMVEISGQTGIVEELGLRMTRLRNYLGQSVAIPNRNIAVVGKYSNGASRAHVDVAVSSPAAAAQASGILRKLCKEIARQFEGVILSDPEVVGPLSLETGEHFVRLRMAIWPLQQWVIDQQLVPRIREVLTREGVEVPGDRVVPFYHFSEKRVGSTWPRSLERIGMRLRRTREPADRPAEREDGCGKEVDENVRP